MNNIVRMLVASIILLPFFGGVSLAGEKSVSQSGTIFLVRHAEKVTQGKDPQLTEQGQARADLLASMLRSVKLDHIYSTNYRRTLQTAEPSAIRQGLKIELYNPKGAQSFADALLAQGGNRLVVGHSNTVPALVALLGGEPGDEIDEAGEYDRLYIVTISENDEMSSVLLRYGVPYVKAE